MFRKCRSPAAGRLFRSVRPACYRGNRVNVHGLCKAQNTAFTPCLRVGFAARVNEESSAPSLPVTVAEAISTVPSNSGGADRHSLFVQRHFLVPFGRLQSVPPAFNALKCKVGKLLVNSFTQFVHSYAPFSHKSGNHSASDSLKSSFARLMRNAIAISGMPAIFADSLMVKPLYKCSTAASRYIKGSEAIAAVTASLSSCSESSSFAAIASGGRFPYCFGGTLF